MTESRIDRNWREYGRLVIEDPAGARHSALAVLLLIAVLSVIVGFSVGALVAGLAGWRF